MRRIIPRGLISKVSETLASRNKEAARALPDSVGGETPKQLQTYRTEIYTYFTRADGVSYLLYSAPSWVRIKLTLETAGAVAIGTVSGLAPTLSGRGRLLDEDHEYETYLPKGTRVYIISENVNRVAVTIEPVPWLEQISTQQETNVSLIRQSIAGAARAVSDAVAALRNMAATRSPSGLAPDELPPIPGSVGRARLTPGIAPKRMP